MKLQLFIVTLFAGVLLLGIAGCSGPSEEWDPRIDWTFMDATIDGQTIVLPELPINVTLKITGEVTVDNTSENPVVTYAWTQEPANAGTFVSTDTLTTNWKPNESVVSVGDEVTLILTMTSLKGGKSVKRLHLIMTPPVEPPVTPPG
ncbi:MAG: hypothetical protein ACYDBB_09255 [Armatimonadota bacterium]